jgi:galactonate dehydratase
VTVRELVVRRLRASHRGDWLVLLLRTADGHTGLGEASQSGDDARTAQLLRDALAPRLRGHDPRRVRPLLARLAEALPAGEDRPARTALSAVEQACWDLLGQSLGVPLHALWGGARRERVGCYANVNRALSDRSPAAFARAAAAAVADGFPAVKIAPFDGVEPVGLGHAPAGRAYAAGLERVAAVREALGPRVPLMVDCHHRFVPADAARLGRDLTPFDLFWLEEPFATERAAEGYPALAAELAVAFAAGEHEADLGRFRTLLGAGVRYLMLDVKHCGGLGPALGIAALAEAHGAQVTLHNPSGPVSQAASAHVTAVLPHAGPLEFPWGEVAWRGALVHPPERVEAGLLPVPSGPGLGIALDAGTAARHAAGGED